MVLQKYIGLFLLITATYAGAQVPYNRFRKEWKEIDSLIVNGNLSRTALQKVESLYQQTKQQEPGQAIKCLLYEYYLQEVIGPEISNPILQKTEQAITDSKDPVQKAVLHSMLAKLYKIYFEAHRWDLYGRKKTSGIIKGDIATWSVEDFTQKITKEYRMSLFNPSLLQQQNITPFEAVVLKGNSKGKSTLFDLLAHEALGYFKTGEQGIPKAKDYYLITNRDALGTADVFSKAVFTVTDSSAHAWQCLYLFQQLLLAHRNDSEKDLLIENDIERIEWVSNSVNFTDRDPLYSKALASITDKWPGVSATSQAWYLLANAEAEKAMLYQTYKDTTHRFGYQKAKELAEKALLLCAENNRGKVNCRNLITRITSKELNTQTELVNIPGKPFRALISYQNIDTLYGKIVLLDEKQLSVLNGRRMPDYEKTINSWKAYREFVQAIPPTNDYQPHRTEIKIDSLPVGVYALIGSDKKNITEGRKMTVQHFYVSNISYVRNRQDVFVLNRETGQPIPGAKVIVYDAANNYADANDVLFRRSEKTTDSDGYLRITEKSRNNSLRLFISKDNDHLFIGRNEYFFPESVIADETADKFEKNNNRIFFFTDRSIYRPGQTVFFKGIGITRDQATGYSKLITRKDSTKVYLNDVNGKKTDSLTFSLNEYGTFSGSFHLPKNGLTGQFSISVPAYQNYSAARISVEEYKRPAFTVSFDKVSGSYHLQDSITLTGSAMAYTGSNVSQAKLVYSVKRNSRFIRPMYRSSRFSEGAEREIAFGEIKTDANGKFTIRFKALADDINNLTEDQIFNYSVTADITDSNGETRSAATSVAVGSRSLLLGVDLPSQLPTDSLRKIHISTTNLNYEKTAASVTLKIYALTPPAERIRKRYWERPDVFVIDQQQYKQFFPEDEYAEESNYQTWAKGSLVTETVIDTKEKDVFRITPGLLKAGYYRIEAFVKEADGKEIQTLAFTQLFDAGTHSVLPFTYALRETARPGDTALFVNYTATDHAYLIRQKSTNRYNTSAYQFIKQNTATEIIRYIPDETDRGGVLISDVYVYNNRVYTNQYNIDVPWNNKQLQIQYTSYRNKTEPGSKERWSVSVQNEAKENVAAELLTGMYDASLDQFRQQSWGLPGLWQRNYLLNNFSGDGNFTTAFGPATENTYISLPEIELTFDRLADYPEGAASFANHNGLPGKQTMMKYASATLADEAVMNKVMIRGKENNPVNTPVYFIDGKEFIAMPDINADEIESVDVLKGSEALARYGNRGENGVVIIKTKNGRTNPEPQKIRTDFNETAFFFPQLYADSSGKYHFQFTMPEALTQWRWMSFAHTKDLAYGLNNTTIVSRKTLMVQPNAPRFLREGDNMEFSAKIINLSDKEITGQVSFELLDAAAGSSVDGWFQNVFPSQYFTVGAGESFPVKFPIQVPYSFNRPLTWRIIAKAGEYSDGEENSLPVLTNRILVTESLPLLMLNNDTRSFRFEKLLSNNSESLSHEGLTVEYSANPIWYAIQALPYLIEYPYECAEQTFNRFYANCLGAMMLNKFPKILEVFAQWKADSSSLKSNLTKNEELKQVLLQETPWVIEGMSEEEQKKNISLLFDMARLSNQSENILEKLSQMQLPNGAFSWFNGGYADRYITNYILTGIGKLKKLGAVTPGIRLGLQIIVQKALQFADKTIAEDYKLAVKEKNKPGQSTIGSLQMDYLYMRSFFPEITQSSARAFNYYYSQSKRLWNKQDTYYKAAIGMTAYRNHDTAFAYKTILPALIENAVLDPVQGMYWKTTYAGHGYQAPVEHQSMMIAFMGEINRKDLLTDKINAMKTWLLLNKQTSHWKTTIATAEACYALLCNGSNWLSDNRKVTIQLGNTQLGSNTEKTEAGTGYFKKRIEGNRVVPDMGNITVSIQPESGSPKKPAVSWGSVYWQYFEDMDKITAAASPLSLSKQLFTEKNTDKGKILEPVKEGDELKRGDKVVIRIELRSTRNMEYLHLKDMRAACMEPVNVPSGYRWQDGLGYYESTKDAASHFFIDHLSKGTYIFEYPVFITHAGLYTAGLTSIESMYAPEFAAHSESIKIRVSE